MDTSSTKFREGLTRWAIDCNIKRSHVTSLLKEIKTNVEAPHQIDLGLPWDYRALLNTPRNTCLKLYDVCDGGKLGWLGIKFGMESVFRDGFRPETSKLTLITFIDGFNPYDTKKKKFWAILHSFLEDPKRRPFMSGLYVGNTEPKPFNHFMRPMVNDMKDLQSGYFSEVLDIELTVKAEIFVLDLPAKADAKSTKKGGYFSCDFCLEEGKWGKSLYYDSFVFEKRTNESFRSKSQAQHHRGESILEELTYLDMVQSFPLDSLHQLYLGIMKKLLEIYLVEPSKNRLNSKLKRELTQKFDLLAPWIVEEFQWRPQSLEKHGNFKGKEFRYLLVYAGIVLFKDILSPAEYEGFLALSIATRILSRNDLVSKDEWLKVADDLLRNFLVCVCRELGVQYIGRNFHNLLHLVDCCRKYGALNNFSNFRFESFLAKINSKISSHKDELQQVINRCIEASFRPVEESPENEKEISAPRLGKIHYQGPVINENVDSQHLHVSIGCQKIKIDYPNNFVLCKTGIVVVANVVVENGLTYLIGRKFNTVAEFYTKPVPLSLLNICEVSNLSSDFVKVCLSDVITKCIAYPNAESYVIVPLIE